MCAAVSVFPSFVRPLGVQPVETRRGLGTDRCSSVRDGHTGEAGPARPHRGRLPSEARTGRFPQLARRRLRKSLRDIYQSDSEGCASSKDLRSHLEHLESELLFLSTLTGINIINYSMKTEDLTSTEKTEKSIKKVLQKHRLSGNCHMITFQLEFEILEIQNKESLSSVITDLNIIMEPTEYSELSEFVSRAEERRDLLMFFRSLRFFVEWCDYRKRTFQHLKDKYPEIVHLPEGAASSCMGVRSACQPGFELVVVWRMHMEEEGKVFPKLDLLPKVPQQALELDQHHVLETAPLRFRTLLGVLGIEAALESLITSLCPADNQVPANTQVVISSHVNSYQLPEKNHAFRTQCVCSFST